MKSRLARLILLALFCLGLPGLVTTTLRAQIEDLQQATEEKAACMRNLKTIYDAIQKYQVDHKELPNWLSDLVPQYLDDVTVLTCPVCKRTGQAEASALADPKISTSYDYEFAPVPLGAKDAPGDPSKTHRDWRRREMSLVGSIVPLVRCHHHNMVLNLAYDGRIYESQDTWELLVTNQVSIFKLMSVHMYSGKGKNNAMAKAAPPPTIVMPAAPRVFPPRDPQAKTNLIDLTAYYNAALAEPWLGRPDNDLATLPTGLQTFGGVQYDVRGLIQLGGKGESSKRYPTEVKGIEVNQKCARLHFLQAVAFGNGVEDGAQVGTYVVHFAANQMQLEIPVLYGRDVRDWHTLAEEKPDPKELQVVWTGTNKVSEAAHKQLRLFATTWENVAPGVEIKSLDFVSPQGVSAPFVIAISAE